jgi:hypothetical protein
MALGRSDMDVNDWILRAEKSESWRKDMPSATPFFPSSQRGRGELSCQGRASPRLERLIEGGLCRPRTTTGSLVVVLPLLQIVLKQGANSVQEKRFSVSVLVHICP